ncbi:MAG TPA: sulfurtransferase TusD, partial [Pseudomonas sp.]|nr:sulfurtransferase TusD [Pseudomonas sp.]
MHKRARAFLLYHGTIPLHELAMKFAIAVFS